MRSSSSFRCGGSACLPSSRVGSIASLPPAAGFAVIEPFLVHAPARMSNEERLAELDRYRARVVGLATAPTIVYPTLADYDERYVLKPELSNA